MPIAEEAVSTEAEVPYPGLMLVLLLLATAASMGVRIWESWRGRKKRWGEEGRETEDILTMARHCSLPIGHP